VERKTKPDLHGSELECWLRQSHIHTTALSKDEIRLGGLQLLVHRCPSEEPDIKKFADAPLPFENVKCLNMVLDEFELPKDYPL
jgi:hypothetical protein